MNKLTHNEIISSLCKAGFQTFLVGGAVRDIFTGHNPHDFDIVTRATPTEIKSVFNDCAVRTVGESFGVTLVEGFEVATFRLDRFPEGNGSKNCKPVFAESIHDDLARRDLTVNALALCSITGELVDDHNGLEDLQNSVVRFVGDADTRIAEDPNRIIRACRFLAKLNGTFHIDTLDALQRNAHLVATHIDPERIGIEILKALELQQPSLFFSALQLIGALKFVFPGLEQCVDHEHGKWHKETVWEHLLLAGDKVSPRFPLVRLAAFLHDAGKPTAFARNNDGTFVGHEVLGSDAVNEWLAALRLSNEKRNFVVGLIRAHMWGGSRDASPKAFRKLRFRLNELGVDVRSWLRLRIADRHANLIKDDFTLREVVERATQVGLHNATVEVVPLNVNDLAVSGGHLIELFSLPRGPVVGQLQKHLLAFVVEHGENFNTEEGLCAEAARFLVNT